MKRIALAIAVAAVAFTASTPANANANVQFDPLTMRVMKPARVATTAPKVQRIPREIVGYSGPYAPGTIVVDTNERRLYYVMGGGQAIRYGIGVARPGFEWSGAHKISMKREWPSWTPPEEMKKRQPGLPDYMPGGIDNPLGARALYIGSTIYRIHGSNQPASIGQAMSSGCIRMLNEDVVDLYERVRIGAQVVVL
ncbi:L,D-transpeptidase [Microbaculum sp. FT89]|uniref:L,D-transpeptidase n=1 Tax=Microbaculum sp. FT89 TaxID=3447298 RepID=UPI003F52EBFF